MMNHFGRYLCYLLRHHPEDAKLDMDIHGYVNIEQLIDHINQYSQYHIDKAFLYQVVDTDCKKRYKIKENQWIKACQGHSIPWVIPELTYQDPPFFVYHGTTLQAWQKIQDSGYISKCKRHAVHTQKDILKAWTSAKRWRHEIPVVLKIDAMKMKYDGYQWGVSDNDVWCVEKVPVKYIIEVIKE